MKRVFLTNQSGRQFLKNSHFYSQHPRIPMVIFLLSSFSLSFFKGISLYNFSCFHLLFFLLLLIVIINLYKFFYSKLLITLQTLNYVQLYVPRGTTYYDKTIRIDKNPIKTALNVCKHLISKRVYAVVVSHDDSSGHDLSPAAVSYTSGFYQIPVIGVSSRDAAFSDKNIHVSFLRTVPPWYHQADVWLEILSHFGYTKVY